MKDFKITKEKARELIETLTFEELGDLQGFIYKDLIVNTLTFEELYEIWERKSKLQKAWEQSKKDKLPKGWKNYRRKEEE